MKRHSTRRRHLMLATGTAGLASATPWGLVRAGTPPVRGGTLNCSLDITPRSLDPIMGDAPTTDRCSLQMVYEGLLRFDPKGELEAALAERWAYATDGRSIRFDLRRDVVFHDGTPFDAEAAAFNLRRAIDPVLNAPRRTDLADIDTVDVLGPHQLRINLKQTSGAALATLAVEAGFMCSPTAVKRLGADYGRNPVGTGPFRFVEWVAGTRIRMERNDRYWRIGADGKPLPYLDAINLRFITNTAVKLVEVKSGNVWLTDTITPKDFAEIEKHPDLRLVANPSGIMQWMTFNVTRPPFDNVRLREAVLAGINRELLMKAVTRGFGRVTPAVTSPNDWSFSADLRQVAYNPERAKQLLAESGYPKDKALTLSVIQRDPDAQVAQFLQAQLRDVGITVRIEVLERQAYVPKVLGHQHEFGIGRLNIPRADPDHVFTPWFGRGGGQNWSGIKDEEVFDAIDAARRETDRPKRKAMYNAIEQKLIDRHYYGFLFFRDNRNVFNRRLNGVVLDIGGAWMLSEAWMAKA